ncbi:MAG: methyltransferase domain-containing protein, partial [Gemmatimonadota bacterium]|nr:methyltransferase domain-containing protein [Gemmatimonadota bacterium]
PVHGDGRKTRTFCYIANATVGFFQVLLSVHNREVYNIGADDPEIQIRHLAALVSGLVMHDEGGIDLVPGPSDVYTKSNPERRCPDLSKIRTEVGYDPKIDLLTGLRRFIAWTREELDAQGHAFRLETACRVCGANGLRPFLSLGKTPLANRLLEDGDPLEEQFFPLEVAYCPACHHCQLSCTVEPDEMFSEYPYVTSTTATFRKHFADMAAAIVERYQLPPRSLVVDVGSNDGLLLKHFQDLGMSVVGVEPARNIVDIARANGVDTIAGYFTEEVADTIVMMKGHASVVTANNVFAHVADVDGFIRHAERLLAPDGILVIEVQYILDTLRTLTFDNVYHEHLSYFSVLSLTELFRRKGMQVYDVEHVDSHGGSLRVFVQRATGTRTVAPAVGEFLAQERASGLDRFDTYEEFGRKVHAIKAKIQEYVHAVRDRQETLVGYGAPAKATTLLNFCGIDARDLQYVVDDNPLKQGMLIPGVRVPIRSADALRAAPPDNVLILAWNFADEIIRNNAALKASGARFIVPLPEPRVVPSGSQ